MTFPTEMSSIVNLRAIRGPGRGRDRNPLPALNAWGRQMPDLQLRRGCRQFDGVPSMHGQYADSVQASRTGIGTNAMGQQYIADLGKAAATIGEGNTLVFGVDTRQSVVFEVKDGKFVSIDPGCQGCTLVQDKDGGVHVQLPAA